MCTRDTSSAMGSLSAAAAAAAAAAVGCGGDGTDDSRSVAGGVLVEGKGVVVAVVVAVAVAVGMAAVVSPQRDVVVDGHGDTAGLRPRGDDDEATLPLPLLAALIVANSLLSLRKPVPGDEDLLEYPLRVLPGPPPPPPPLVLAMVD